MFIKTKSGQRECGYEGENNDCSVRALAEAAEITYAESYAFWEKLGRKKGKGVFLSWFDNYLKQNNNIVFGKQVTCKNIPFYLPDTHSYSIVEDKWIRHTKRTNVKTFLEQNPKGKFMLVVTGHVKAIVDGIILDDSEGIYCEIIKVYEFL